MTSLSFVDTLLVAVVGILVVFFGLAVLIMLIKAMGILTGNAGKKKEKPVQAAPVPVAKIEPAAAPAAPAAPAAQSNDELIAVITAAVAAMMGEGNGFTVRRVRRINNTPAWAKAGREEQIYSRF